MMSPAQIRDRAERKFVEFLRSALNGDAFFPHEVRDFGRPNPSGDYGEMKTAIEALHEGSKAVTGHGYTVDWSEANFRLYGRQRVPARVYFANEEDFLSLIGRGRDAAGFRRDSAAILEAFPILAGWVRSNVRTVVDEKGVWPDIIRICQWFVANPRRPVYLREIPAPHTKFIEDHRDTIRGMLDLLLSDHINPVGTKFEERFGLRFDESPVRIRFLDPAAMASNGFPVPDVACPASDFARVSVTARSFVVCENKMTFLTLPPLASTVAVLGMGQGSSILGALPWLRNANVTYWGDIDPYGFRILSGLRHAIPRLSSVMMDLQTLRAHASLLYDAAELVGTPPDLLSPAEAAAFDEVVLTRRGLEQERISLEYSKQVLAAF